MKRGRASASYVKLLKKPHKRAKFKSSPRAAYGGTSHRAVLKPEKNYINIPMSLQARYPSVNNPTDNVVSNLTPIGQGPGESQRIGRKVVVRNIRIRGRLGMDFKDDNATVPNGARIRVVLYVDHQNTGSSSVVNYDTMFDTSSGTGPTKPPLSDALKINAFLKIENQNRFTILYDKWHVLNRQNLTVLTGGNFAASAYEKNLKINKFCSIPMEYLGATGDQGELTSNCIGCSFWVEEGLDDEATTFEGVCRIRFDDH